MKLCDLFLKDTKICTVTQHIQQFCHYFFVQHKYFEKQMRSFQEEQEFHICQEKAATKLLRFISLLTVQRQDRIVDPLYFSVKDANLNYTKDQV